MNKSDLIKNVAEKSKFTKKASEKAVDAIIEAVSESLAKQEEVRFVKFGTFKVKIRAARMVHHPRTGQIIRIKAAKIPTFKPSTSLKAAVGSK